MQTLKYLLKPYLRPLYYRFKYHRAKHRNQEKLTMPDTIRWGIIGTGSIAGAFAYGLSILPDATLAAVGSRSQKAADKFGEQFGVPKRYPSYAALAHDPEIDAVYIATPHNLHEENTLLCLEAGKAVLCEKPFAINAAQSERMIQKAREKKLFLMEAMWTRFLPSIVHLRELLSAGEIGEVRMLQADFGFRTNFDPKSRAFDPALGGGALLDVGIYPISLASMVFGRQPAQITSQARLGQTGVDEECAGVFQYEDEQMALVSAAVRTETPQEATIMGTKGWIRLHRPFFKTEKLSIYLRDQKEREIAIPMEGNGYNYEAAEVMACLRAGKLASSIMPLDETLAIMQTLDKMRAQWGLKYPGE